MHFKGPFHFEHLSQLRLIPGPDKGIYIWGFVYEFDKTGLIEPVNYKNETIPSFKATGIDLPKTQKFIPYYVGKRKNGQILNRIIEHHSLKGDVMKYIRFTYSFMKLFFMGDCKFPVHYGSSYKNFIDYYTETNPNKIAYFNSHSLLKLLYPKVSIKPDPSGNVPINYLTKGTILCDELVELIENKNNFWFCYAEADDAIKLDDAEASTYWSLKGLTVSKIKKKATAISLTAQPSCQAIFKNLGPNNLPTIYHVSHADPLIFPGY